MGLSTYIPYIHEMQKAPTGRYSPSYYKNIGFTAAKGKPLSRARAQAVYTLLGEPEPYIYTFDTIVGCMRSFFVSPKQSSDEAIKTAEEEVAAYGDRTFATNGDHFAPDYRTVVALGIPGMLKKIAKSKENHQNEPEKCAYLDDMALTLQGLLRMMKNYADKAEALLGSDGYDNDTLTAIVTRCKALCEREPRSFAEGLQLVWFCHTAFVAEGRYAMALGRMDQYLYPLFKKDVETGLLDEERATALLSNVFIKIYERHALFGGDDVVNICVGGSDVNDRCEINRLSFCVLNAVDICGVPGPNLTARITEDTPDAFLDRCLQVIGTGIGYPALSNDRINLAALRRYGYAEEDVRDYCMVGCIENLIAGKQRPWVDGRFDTPRFFEYLFNEGKAIRYPADGINTGKVSEIHSMDELMRKYEEQLHVGAQQYVQQYYNFNHIEHPENFTTPFLSCFCRDCIERGMDINNGGARYPSVYGAVLMGVGTVADSLAAIEKVVYVDREATLEDIRQGMLCDFQGMEELRQKLLAAPKYGNNDDFVDKYAVWFVNFLSDEFDKLHTEDGGGIYTAMAANVSNIYAGRSIAATPDGRHAGESLSDAASPTHGRDLRGATSTVLSLVKPDYTRVACGTVVNQKFSPSMFKDGKREKLLSLIRVYFAKGGHEIQINATSRTMLRDAMDHPVKYPNMVVRVSGFSALYITLDRAVQEDILERTQQD